MKSLLWYWWIILLNVTECYFGACLQKLVLQKQESLSSLTLQCRNLIDVDLSDCESLTNAICEVFSDGGGCPMLRSLILDNCEVWCVTFMRSLCFKLEKISCYLNASELRYYSTFLLFCHNSCFQLFLLFMYFQDICANLFITLKFWWCIFLFRVWALWNWTVALWLVSLLLVAARWHS